MYSTYNKGKFVTDEKFKYSKNSKIYKYMTSISKNVYTDDKLDNIVNKYNNTYHSAIKMKPASVKSSTYIDSSKDINNKDPKIGDTIRISKYQNITMFLQKGTLQIGLRKFLWLKS